MAKQLVLILGGARSGKSRYAQELAPQLGARVAYLATAEARDDEMQTRIANHRAERPADWQTLEAARAVGATLARAQADVIILDCLTLLVTNVMLAAEEADQPARVNDEVVKLLAAYRAGNFSLVIVSNEVGMGIVPDNALARAYRDLLGAVNQHIARVADSVVLMVAGLPMRVK
jgi:adenosyl cobinamide kinase/adenosyl cobinamide phosphate guanylyltransferase